MSCLGSNQIFDFLKFKSASLGSYSQSQILAFSSCLFKLNSPKYYSNLSVTFHHQVKVCPIANLSPLFSIVLKTNCKSPLRFSPDFQTIYSEWNNIVQQEISKQFCAGTSHTYRQHRQNLGLKSDESIHMQSFLPDPRSSPSVVPVPSSIIPKSELEIYNKNESKTDSGPSNGSEQSRYIGIDSNDLKKGKRSFAELQQEFGSSGQNKVSQNPEMKSGEPALNENKSETSSQNKPPDLSPGRIEDGLWQNDAKVIFHKIEILPSKLWNRFFCQFSLWRVWPVKTSLQLFIFYSSVLLNEKPWHTMSTLICMIFYRVWNLVSLLFDTIP